jgi:hypothetical protein
MCIRCRQQEAPSPLGLCTVCVVHTRIELGDGFRKLGRYLGAWAAFSDWLEDQGLTLE